MASPETPPDERGEPGLARFHRQPRYSYSVWTLPCESIRNLGTMTDSRSWMRSLPDPVTIHAALYTLGCCGYSRHHPLPSIAGRNFIPPTHTPVSMRGSLWLVEHHVSVLDAPCLPQSWTQCPRPEPTWTISRGVPGKKDHSRRLLHLEVKKNIILPDLLNFRVPSTRQ